VLLFDAELQQTLPNDTTLQELVSIGSPPRPPGPPAPVIEAFVKPEDQVPRDLLVEHLNAYVPAAMERVERKLDATVSVRLG
jgi:hypothetical protein